MIVLDASAALALVNGSQEGWALRSLILEGERIVAPELFRYEFVNIIRKYVQGGFITRDTALAWYNAAESLVDEFVSLGDMAPEILAEPLSTQHPSYDISYLVLARRRAATLLTLDKRLAQVCAQRGVNCVEPVSL